MGCLIRTSERRRHLRVAVGVGSELLHEKERERQVDGEEDGHQVQLGLIRLSEPNLVMSVRPLETLLLPRNDTLRVVKEGPSLVT